MFTAHIESTMQMADTLREEEINKAIALAIEVALPSPEDFPQWVRKRRKAAKLTRYAMANQLGVSVPAIVKWEQGLAVPTLPAVVGLLGLPILNGYGGGGLKRPKEWLKAQRLRGKRAAGGGGTGEPD
jgi:DNA-binding transcriptional regulator YiaG